MPSAAPSGPGAASEDRTRAARLLPAGSGRLGGSGPALGAAGGGPAVPEGPWGGRGARSPATAAPPAPPWPSRAPRGSGPLPA